MNEDGKLLWPTSVSDRSWEITKTLGTASHGGRVTAIFHEPSYIPVFEVAYSVNALACESSFVIKEILEGEVHEFMECCQRLSGKSAEQVNQENATVTAANNLD